MLGNIRKWVGQEARRLRVQALLAHLQTPEFLEPPPSYEGLNGLSDAIQRDMVYAENKLSVQLMTPMGMGAAGSPSSPPTVLKSPLDVSSPSARKTRGSTSKTAAAAALLDLSKGPPHPSATLEVLQVRGGPPAGTQGEPSRENPRRNR